MNGLQWLTGCMAAEFAVVWSLGIAAFDAFAAGMLAGWIDGGPATGMVWVLFLIPFNATAIGLWVMLVILVRDFRSPTGCARVRPTDTGWQAVLPDHSRYWAAGTVLWVSPVAAILVLRVGFGTIPPPWATGIGVGVVLLVAAGAYRRWHYDPVLLVDEVDRTVTLPKGRSEPPETIPWSSVIDLEVVEVTTVDEGKVRPVRNDVVVKVVDCVGSRSVVLRGRGMGVPVERFAAWLRERIGLARAKPPVA